MLDRHLRPLIDPPLDRAASVLAQAGLGATTLTLVGLVLGLAAGAFAAFGLWGAALAAFVGSRLADGLDGPVARRSAPNGSPFGGHLDILADFAAYAALPLGFVLHDPASNGSAGAALLAAFYVNAASFLGFAILAERRGERTEVNGRKSFFHSAGLLEGTETIAFMVLICLAPHWFAPLSWAFAALCLLTVGLRTAEARRRDGSATAHRTGATVSSRSTQ